MVTEQWKGKSVDLLLASGPPPLPAVVASCCVMLAAPCTRLPLSPPPPQGSAKLQHDAMQPDAFTDPLFFPMAILLLPLPLLLLP